jgi:transcriptional regulator with XRE-family HTH domain
MRRLESKFVTPIAAETARRLGGAIRAARLARNATQESIAARARMSPLTWLKIEKGNVSVALASWLSALEQVGLLPLLEVPANPEADQLGAALRRQQARVRARPSPDAGKDYDF